jgi:dual specificity tyrosine-phosphorylation-regulated kinase 2/3/4
MDLLGKGSFGKVVRVFDHKKKVKIALKVIRNKKRFHRQAMVEIKVLEDIRFHDRDSKYSVIHIMSHFMFRNHICISFELLNINLYEFLKLNDFHGLSQGLVRRVGHQLLQSLRLFKKLNIIHCDLKPENILLR